MICTDVMEVAIYVLGFALTLGLSGIWINLLVIRPSTVPSPPGARLDPSVVIGKCENVLILVFVLAGQIAGIAVVLAAKALVRREAQDEKANYYLSGTFVNLVWSVLMGYAMLKALECFRP